MGDLCKYLILCKYNFFVLFSIYETIELTIVHSFKHKSNTKHSPLALCYFLFANSLSLLQLIICVCPKESHSQTLCPHAHQKPLTLHIQYHGPLQISKLLCWISHRSPPYHLGQRTVICMCHCNQQIAVFLLFSSQRLSHRA